MSFPVGVRDGSLVIATVLLRDSIRVLVDRLTQRLLDKIYV